MKISTKGRYSLRVMIDLAEHQSEGYISLKDIAARQEVSKKYLEQIIPLLTSAGMLKTIRGAQGGYKLAKAPKDYTVGQILRVTEGPLTPVDCAVQDPIDCPRSTFCPTLPIWKELTTLINDYLDGITLQDILDRQQEFYSNNYII